LSQLGSNRRKNELTLIALEACQDLHVRGVHQHIEGLHALSRILPHHEVGISPERNIYLEQLRPSLNGLHGSWVAGGILEEQPQNGEPLGAQLVVHLQQRRSALRTAPLRPTGRAPERTCADQEHPWARLATRIVEPGEANLFQLGRFEFRLYRIEPSLLETRVFQRIPRLRAVRQMGII